VATLAAYARMMEHDRQREGLRGVSSGVADWRKRARVSRDWSRRPHAEPGHLSTDLWVVRLAGDVRWCEV